MTRISPGDVVETRSDHVQWIVTARFTTATSDTLNLKRDDGETITVNRSEVKRVGRQVPLLGGQMARGGGE